VCIKRDLLLVTFQHLLIASRVPEFQSVYNCDKINATIERKWIHMIEIETEQCLGCGRPLTQQGGVHRKRRYCDEACRQRAHRARQAEQAEAERKGSLQSDQEQAARLEKLEEEKQALLRECGRQAAEARQQEAQIAKLMAENARLRRRLDLETNHHMDTRQHNFKPCLRKQRYTRPAVLRSAVWMIRRCHCRRVALTLSSSCAVCATRMRMSRRFESSGKQCYYRDITIEKKGKHT
jgi:hypothetical protein